MRNSANSTQKHLLPSGSHSVGWGSGRVCRWPLRRRSYTPDKPEVAMMCCSVETKQTQTWNITVYLHDSSQRKKSYSPMFYYHIVYTYTHMSSLPRQLRQITINTGCFVHIHLKMLKTSLLCFPERLHGTLVWFSFHLRLFLPTAAIWDLGSDKLCFTALWVRIIL